MSVPDVKIFPHATGLASKTISEHQDKQDLVFYSGWVCPYVQRTRIVLEERGIPYQYVEVNPYKKGKHFLEINPKGLVPAVEWKGQALYESLILCEFLEDAFPSQTPHILPSDPIARGRVRIWVDFISKSVVPAFMRTVMAQEPAKQAESLQEFYNALRTLMAQVEGPYFAGEEFTLADVAVAPWIVRDYILRDNRGYDRSAVGSGWNEYAERIESRDSLKKTSSDKYTEIYGRYLRDEAMSEAAKAIRAGRPF
ncbi:glutathione-S-transferase [Epithele typhae]|uniref:glutathione-S-transferase n=1 Tax=Epithele typhae TaxID=378194 RepID=UPI002007BC40|nr:glutathione-S-transferase [Epithele typhae]KAH9917095.1 glutathione-S-transferase [Epithele typhae]